MKTRSRIQLILLQISIVYFSAFSLSASPINGNLNDYKIGDKGPAGGYIVYINPNSKVDGWKYLEASSEDLNGGNPMKWCNVDTVLVGTLTNIGSGKENTNKIISLKGHTFSAAKTCVDYRGGGFKDWFLPSQDELNLIYTTLKKEMGLKFQDFIYASSSEDQNFSIWYQDFRDGYRDSAGGMEISKDLMLYVRAMRRF